MSLTFQDFKSQITKNDSICDSIIPFKDLKSKTRLVNGKFTSPKGYVLF